MAHPLSSIIDAALNRAEKAGEFDNLPGAGKPLKSLNKHGDPVMNTLLKENHAKPPAVIMKQQISEEMARLKTLSDPDARKASMRRLADLQMRLAMELEAYRRYG